MLPRRILRQRDAIREILGDGAPRTPPQILSELPEVADQAGAIDGLLLLLRLDRHLKSVNAERWTLVNHVSDSHQRIVELTQQYLDELPGGGGLLANVVVSVVKQTGFDREAVEAVITSSFQTMSKAVLNKRKDFA